jgi:lipopolysaccharide transport system permease protein
MRFFLRLFQHRNLLKNLIRRDLKRRYVGSIGGFLWSVVHPLAMLFSYWFFFGIVLGIRLTPEDGTDSFPIFLFCGILPWILFSDTVLRSCGVIVENTSLITKTIIPAEMLPVAITLSNLIHHAIGLSLLLVILLVSHTAPMTALAVLPYLLMLILFAQGLGWLVAGLQVFLRDTFQALQIVLFLWQWFTPIFYSLDRVPEPYRTAMMFNPMVIVVTGYRNSLLHLNQPEPSQIAGAAAISVAVFLLGGLIFRQAKPAFADVL